MIYLLATICAAAREAVLATLESTSLFEASSSSSLSEKKIIYMNLFLKPLKESHWNNWTNTLKRFVKVKISESVTASNEPPHILYYTISLTSYKNNYYNKLVCRLKKLI